VPDRTGIDEEWGRTGDVVSTRFPPAPPLTTLTWSAQIVVAPVGKPACGQCRGDRCRMTAELPSLAGAKFLTVAEVATLMRVSKMTVYRLVHSAELPAIRVGRSFRVPEQAVHDYLRASFVEAG